MTMKQIDERFVRHVLEKARGFGFTKRQRDSVYNQTKLYRLYAYAYQKALADLAHEFESHDYFSEAGKTRSFAKTSEWVVWPEMNQEEQSSCQ